MAIADYSSSLKPRCCNLSCSLLASASVLLMMSVVSCNHQPVASAHYYLCTGDRNFVLGYAPCCIAVFVSYALVSLTDAVLYTNPKKVTPEVAAHLKEGGVVVKPYEQLVSDIRAKAAAKAKIAMDMSKVSRRWRVWVAWCGTAVSRVHVTETERAEGERGGARERETGGGGGETEKEKRGEGKGEGETGWGGGQLETLRCRSSHSCILPSVRVVCITGRSKHAWPESESRCCRNWCYPGQLRCVPSC